MSSPAILVINKEKYMSTKTAADLWNLSTRTVANYCNNDRIHRKFKNGKLGWYIHIDEIKPLTDIEVHKLLVLSIQLKNNPALMIDWTSFNFDGSAIDIVYRNLEAEGFILPYDVKDYQRIPYEVVLTQKGLEMATAFRKKSIPDYATLYSQWLPILINIAQLYFQIVQIT